ncbi:uncharacterized protein BT62DRAFT_955490 [Guyanagaster necrorhizus]|uniref:F-box domain-containing protein n=1 Tax=Guyanagaster necrorhizus TaxID=856835 RepID=A0A9P7VJC5_9AGAR|nr:uncharacterized protein BT62DRAFT_955490 [Guyanagaster necrorhizus MCA 3950]KAG7441677.1 hypothetical protein BT62DRAFT_955490 [Guyanagaster necrorhizus MCA 3950]
MSPSLFSLPPEILTQCMEYLDYWSLLQCTKVCRAFKNVVNGSLALQYKTELAMDSMEDGESSHLLNAERLERLRELRRAWANLDWKEFTSIPFSGECSAYELVAGVFVKMFLGRDFSSTRLPSSTRPTVHQVVFPDQDMLVKDFAMDPSQDLLAMLVDDASPPSYTTNRILTMHLRSLSTLNDHPEAEVPRINISIRPGEMWANLVGVCTIQVAQDSLALFIRQPIKESHLYIWNWKTGKLLINHDDHGDLPRGVYHFGFVTWNTYILTTTSSPGYIYLVQISEELKYRTIVVLQLPEIVDNVHIDAAITHSGAITASAIDGELFIASPERRIHTFTVTYAFLDPAREAATYTLFVPNEAFLQYISDYEDRSKNLLCYLLWENWGPRHTRMLPNEGTFNWMRYAYGEKVVCPAIPGRNVLQVLDFNVYPSRPRPPTTCPFSRGRIITGPTTLDRAHIFKQKVQTCLPFYSTSREMAKEYSGFMIDEQRIIALKVHD